MARPRKESVQETTTGDGKLIKLFSSYRGDIHLPDGRVVKHQEPIDVTEDVAVYLEKSFKGDMRRL